MNLLLEYLPSPDTVKRYNGIGESSDDDKTQCNRNNDRFQDTRNDYKTQDTRNDDKTQDTLSGANTQDSRTPKQI